MKKQMLLKIICLCFLLLPLSGCWDKKEIERKAYVVAIGMDASKHENQFKITYLISNPEFGTQQQGGATNEPAHEIITFETKDLISPMNKANTVIAKEISYDLLRNIIVSEKLAAKKGFIRWMYDMTKEKGIRRDSFLIVTKEDASTFLLNNHPRLETRPHKYFDLIINTGIATGIIPYADLQRYFRITEADADLFLAILGTSEHNNYASEDNKGDDILAGDLPVMGEANSTQLIGSAVFKEGKMIGKLTGEETRLSAILSTAIKAPDNLLATFPDPFNKNYTITAGITQIKNIDLKMNLKKGASAIHVTVPLQVDVLTDHSFVDYEENPKKREDLKSFLEKKFTEKMKMLVTKTQKEFKGEPFGWSLAARRKFASNPDYEAFNWMKSYPDMDVNITVQIRFGKFGRQSNVPNLDKVRD